MNLKTGLKVSIDFTMSVLFLLSLAYPFTGRFPHEVLGTALGIFFILHNLLNAGWYKHLLCGEYNLRRAILTGINLLLLVAMLGLILTGIFISRDIFSFLQLGGSWTAKRWHSVFAYWGFVLSAVHLGLHGGLIAPLFKRIFPSDRLIGLYIAAGLTALYGICALFYWKVFSHLGIGSFTHIPRGRSFLSFLAGHLAILFLLSAGRYLLTCAWPFRKKSSGENSNA